MSIQSVGLKYRGVRFLDNGAYNKQFRLASAATLRAIASEWHAKYLPQHFTKAGAAKYGYKKRKGEGMSANISSSDISGSFSSFEKKYKRTYAYKKQRMFGHSDPLVFSGEGKQLSRLRKIRGNSKQAKVVLPSKFNFKNPKSQIKMRDELTAITSSEQDTLGEMGSEVVTDHMNNAQHMGRF